MNETTTIFILSVLASAVLGSFGYSWKLSQIADRRADELAERANKDAARVKAVHDEAMQSCNKYITREVQRLEQNFYEYKLHVANSFASLAHLQESERRTQHSLEGINAKLDRLIEGRPR